MMKRIIGGILAVTSVTCLVLLPSTCTSAPDPNGATLFAATYAVGVVGTALGLYMAR